MTAVRPVGVDPSRYYDPYVARVAGVGAASVGATSLAAVAAAAQQVTGQPMMVPGTTMTGGIPAQEQGTGEKAGFGDKLWALAKSVPTAAINIVKGLFTAENLALTAVGAAAWFLGGPIAWVVGGALAIYGASQMIPAFADGVAGTLEGWQNDNLDQIQNSAANAVASGVGLLMLGKGVKTAARANFNNASMRTMMTKDGTAGPVTLGGPKFLGGGKTIHSASDIGVISGTRLLFRQARNTLQDGGPRPILNKMWEQVKEPFTKDGWNNIKDRRAAVNEEYDKKARHDADDRQIKLREEQARLSAEADKKALRAETIREGEAKMQQKLTQLQDQAQTASDKLQAANDKLTDLHSRRANGDTIEADAILAAEGEVRSAAVALTKANKRVNNMQVAQNGGLHRNGTTINPYTNKIQAARAEATASEQAALDAAIPLDARIAQVDRHFEKRKTDVEGVNKQVSQLEGEIATIDQQITDLGANPKATAKAPLTRQKELKQAEITKLKESLDPTARLKEIDKDLKPNQEKLAELQKQLDQARQDKKSGDISRIEGEMETVRTAMDDLTAERLALAEPGTLGRARNFFGRANQQTPGLPYVYGSTLLANGINPFANDNYYQGQGQAV